MKLSKVSLLVGLALSSISIVGVQFSAQAFDRGYDHLPKARIDVNNDGRIDYCRFVGDAPNIFIACDIGTSSQYAYQSVRGIDAGYSNHYRGFRDINGDGYGDYCRYVGNSPNIYFSCNLGRKNGFDKNQYTCKHSCTAPISKLKIIHSDEQPILRPSEPKRKRSSEVKVIEAIFDEIFN